MVAVIIEQCTISPPGDSGGGTTSGDAGEGEPEGSVAGSVSNWKVISPGIVTWPVEGKIINISHHFTIFAVNEML